MTALAMAGRAGALLRNPMLALAAFAAQAVRGMAKSLANRAAIRQLAEADDHMLRDIGLSRSDVTSALRAPPLSDPGAHIRAFAER
jgi:uncharacterized protein YjiS (DUF1127 family)